MCHKQAEERVLIIREYWRTNSFKQRQRTFRNKYGEGSILTKYCIRELLEKLETTGSVLTRHAGGRKMCGRTVQDMNDRLLASPRKSLRRLSQETGIPYSACQRAAKERNCTYVLSIVKESLQGDLEKNMQYCLEFQRLAGEHLGILDITWFTGAALFHLSVYINSQNTRIWAEKPHMKFVLSLYIRR
jgi:hypothetical protein